MAEERLPTLTRRTHRGRRSFSALSERRAAWSSLPVGPPYSQDACEAASVDGLESELFTFIYLNIRGYTSHEAELCAVTEQLGYPTFLGLVETFLSKQIKHVKLPGYTLVSRRDRKDESGWGGILFCCEGCIQGSVGSRWR